METTASGLKLEECVFPSSEGAVDVDSGGEDEQQLAQPADDAGMSGTMTSRPLVGHESADKRSAHSLQQLGYVHAR